MSQIVPTIIAKNVIEAMELYKSVLNAEIGKINMFSGIPGVELKDGQKDFIIHAELIKDGKHILYFNEEKQDTPYGKVIPGNNIPLTVNFDTVEEITKSYNILKDAGGSEIIVPLEDAFWGAKYGMIKDRFNVVWQLNCYNNK